MGTTSALLFIYKTKSGHKSNVLLLQQYMHVHVLRVLNKQRDFMLLEKTTMSSVNILSYITYYMFSVRLHDKLAKVNQLLNLLSQSFFVRFFLPRATELPQHQNSFQNDEQELSFQPSEHEPIAQIQVKAKATLKHLVMFL